MLKNFLDYSKCCVENKFTIFGYMSLFTYITAENLISESDNLYLPTLITTATSAILNLGLTHFGIDGFKSYKLSKANFEKNNTLSKHFLDSHYFESSYCVKAGIKTFAKEKSLEHLLEN